MLVSKGYMEKALSALSFLPKNFPTRTVTVKNWSNFTVPRHIVRIDSAEKKTHGWQVRYRGTKFFSDALRGDKMRTPVSALALAIEFLAERYQGQSALLKKTEDTSKAEKTGTPGIRITRKLNRRGF